MTPQQVCAVCGIPVQWYEWEIRTGDLRCATHAPWRTLKDVHAEK